MSQSATLYSVSQEIFEHLEKLNGEQSFDPSAAKNYETFDGSFIALEYILTQGQDDPTVKLASEIFNPSKSLGAHNIETLTPEEQFEAYDSGIIMPYIDNGTISKISMFLNQFSSSDISLKYDADKLNREGIYPTVWHNNNANDLAFNQNHILEDFEKLKAIFNQSDKEKDYILVYIG